jgi:hypothetical protein
MKTLLKNIFLVSWQRKAVALLLGMIIWLVVNHSLTSTKTISNISVRVINIPPGKTIEGMQSNGKLNKKLTLTIVGNTNILEDLNSNDLEVVIDAMDKPEEWTNVISKKNLVSLNPEIDLGSGISRIYQPNFVLHMTNLVTEEIPVLITRPFGEPPRGYRFLDVWPYHLNVKVSGPEDVIKRLKLKEQKLTFNLNDISKTQLDALAAHQNTDQSGVVSFFVPEQWKQINIPLLSDTPIEINDPEDTALRIDFIRYNLIQLDSSIVVSVFYPTEFSKTLNPNTLKIKSNQLVSEENGIFTINTPLYAKGSDRLFTRIVKDWIQVVIIASPKTSGQPLEWNLQFINASELEDEYVSALMTDSSDEDIKQMRPSLRDEYLRNRFRSYMNRFELYKSESTKFEPDAVIEGDFVEIRENIETDSSV